MRIVLASASPRRSELLKQIGLAFEVIVSDVEEVITQSLPHCVVEELSVQKAEDVFSRLEGDTIVIGADTVVAMDGNILGKPRNREHAVEMLSMLQNKEHCVYTGVTVLGRKGEEVFRRTFSECTKVYFYPMTTEEVNWYVDTKEPMDKAGAYGIQGLGARFVKQIAGDYNNVVGLPIARLYQEIKDIL